jgi:CBS domain-containing protein
MARGVDPRLSVREAMVGTEAVVSVSPHDPMDLVLQRLEEGRAQVALVSDGGRLVGVIEREDLTRFFGRQRAASAQASPPRPDLSGTD